MNAARLTIWDDDACRRVHEATLEVLAETGIEVRYAPAAELFARAGAQVDGTRVRIPAELVEAAITSAPRDWTIKPRGGDTEPSSSTPRTRTAAPAPTCSTSATPRRASAAACAAPTSRAWPRSARSCPTSTS